MRREKILLALVNAVCAVALALTFFCVILVVFLLNPGLLDWKHDMESTLVDQVNPVPVHWVPPRPESIPSGKDGELIRYGKELVSHTSKYLGPNGVVGSLSNGMNCQNCHLEAGTKLLGNNYAAVASTYPKFRARSGTVETVEKRINDCIERSLNGKALEAGSRELQAIAAYVRWVGSEVPRDSVPDGTGILQPKPMDRPADPIAGKLIFEKTCTRCHGPNGEGMREPGVNEWKYPPLYGKDSYNTGAGLYRLSRFAGFVKYNMPNDLATADKPFLSDEECWDVAAFVNSMPRPTKDLSGDWPDISKKPFDHPFGPFADGLPEKVHKYGPFAGRIKK